MQEYKSYSLFASILSALTTGLMIACIISVVIIFVLFFIKNMQEKEEHQTVKPITDDEDSNNVDLQETGLKGMLFLEGSCIVNGMLLGKWVSIFKANC